MGESSRSTERQDTSTLLTSPKMRGQSSKFSTYTPLNVLHSEVLMQRRKKAYILWPEPMRTPLHRRNMSKFYQFHRDHEHDTEECIQMKNKIEALIKRGYLSRFIKKEVPQREPHEQRRPNGNKKEERVRGKIVVIFGGSASGGDSGGARKRYAKQVLSTERGEPSSNRKKQNDDIIFDSGGEGVQQPHDDTPVLSLLVANYKVRRILIDNGSSANVMFCSSYNIDVPPQDEIPYAAQDMGGQGRSSSILELLRHSAKREDGGKRNLKCGRSRSKGAIFPNQHSG
ncbi:uncharacterized protein LOC131160908 [Malania oleifera]|uniref:uncharacterized protein LOC131160908 n=1 Tax=Malania oleifera TaxID=397392 RepID=UPI0025AEC0B3|nr:uncharacterized protein LOC131160908 [Malania oleifera]